MEEYPMTFPSSVSTTKVEWLSSARQSEMCCLTRSSVLVFLMIIFIFVSTSLSDALWKCIGDRYTKPTSHTLLQSTLQKEAHR
jgi:hypothetical protein